MTQQEDSPPPSEPGFDPLVRVARFVQEAEARKARDEEELRFMRATAHRLQENVTATRVERDKSVSEVARLQAALQQEVTERARRVAEETEKLVGDRLVGHLDATRKTIEDASKRKLDLLEGQCSSLKERLKKQEEEYKRRIQETSEKHVEGTERALANAAERQRTFDQKIADVRTSVSGQAEVEIKRLESELEQASATRERTAELHQGEMLRLGDAAVEKFEAFKSQVAAAETAVKTQFKGEATRTAKAHEQCVRELEKSATAAGKGAKTEIERLSRQLKEGQEQHAVALRQERAQRQTESDAFATQLKGIQEVASSLFEERVRDLENGLTQALELVAASDSKEGTLRTEIETLKATMADEIESARKQVRSSYEHQFDELQQSLVARTQIYDDAKDTITELQSVLSKTRDEHSATLEDTEQRHAAEVTELAETNADNQGQIEQLTAAAAKLEDLLNNDDAVRQAAEWEQYAGELEASLKESDRESKMAMESLRIFKTLCDDSLAARSLLAGRDKKVDLDALFKILEGPESSS